MCGAAAAYQLWRVPRLWAFLLLFIVLMPKVPLAVVPGNTTPLRVDDVVIGLVIGFWAWRKLRVRFADRTNAAPTSVRPSPATLYLLLYGSAVLVCTLLGIASLTTEALTGALHLGRFVEYGLLYYVFYTTIDPDELDAVVEVFRSALLIVCGIWLVQHWTHAPAADPTPWATLYPTFSATYDFGGYLMLTTIVLYAAWTTGRSRSVWTTMALVAGAYLTVNSESRSSLLGLGLVVAIDLLVRLRWKAVAGIAVVTAAAPYAIRSQKMLTLVNGIYALVTTLNTEVIRNAFATDLSLALRLRNWRLALEHWLARPFTGDGLGGYLRYTRQYDMPASTDGWYIRVLADSGVVGLTAFLLLIAALLWTLLHAFQRERTPLRRAIVYGAALAVAAAAASAVLVDTFVSYKIMGVFWMIVGVGTRVAAAGQPDPSALPDLPGLLDPA